MYLLFEVAATAVNLDQVTKDLIAVSSGESWATVSAFFVCTFCGTQNAPGCRDFIPIHVSTTWPALYLGWEDIVALHSEMDNDPQTRAGFLSSRLSVWCTAIRHQNASQCLVIHWRPPVSSSVDLLKKQSLTRAFQARQRFHGGWRIIIELWHNRLPSSFAATRILHPHMWPNFECLLVSTWTKMATDC